MTCANALRQPGYWKMELVVDMYGYPRYEPLWVIDVTSHLKCDCAKCNDQNRVYVELECS